MPKPQPRSREEDEQGLRWVRWRHAGHRAKDIAAHEGVAPVRVRAVVNRIVDEDREAHRVQRS